MSTRADEGARWRRVVLAALLSLSGGALVSAASPPPLSSAGPLLEELGHEVLDPGQPKLRRLGLVGVLGTCLEHTLSTLPR